MINHTLKNIMQFFITFAGMKTSQIIMDTSLYTNIPNLFPNFKR